jgi:hypothetical protein
MIITYTKPGKDIRCLRGEDIKEDMDLAVSLGGLFKAAMPLLKKGAKTLGREVLKTGLNIAGDVVQGRNIKQAGSRSTIEINRTKRIPESYGHGRTPRTTSYKRTCQAKKDQTSAD